MTTQTSLTEFHTARDLRSHLTDLGVEGDAAEALVRETAGARHAWRVGQARDAALAGARAFLVATDGEGGAADYPETGVLALAAALCLLDQVGIGGRDGVEGLASERLPALRGLGKGRKQASDGAAWDAAILGARRELCAGAGQYTGPLTMSASSFRRDDGSARALLDFFVATGDDLDAAAQTPSVGVFLDEVPADLLPWFLTLCRDGLRCALGQRSWLGVGDFSRPAADWVYDGPAGAWAEGVNVVQARTRACKDAAEAAVRAERDRQDREWAQRSAEVSQADGGVTGYPRVEVARRRTPPAPTAVVLSDDGSDSE